MYYDLTCYIVFLFFCTFYRYRSVLTYRIEREVNLYRLVCSVISQAIANIKSMKFIIVKCKARDIKDAINKAIFRFALIGLKGVIITEFVLPLIVSMRSFLKLISVFILDAGVFLLSCLNSE